MKMFYMPLQPMDTSLNK